MTERAGKAESVTEFDSEFESLCEQMDQIKLVTEKMLAQLEILMQPNPSESPPLPHPSTQCPCLLPLLPQTCVWKIGPGTSWIAPSHHDRTASACWAVSSLRRLKLLDSKHSTVSGTHPLSPEL